MKRLIVVFALWVLIGVFSVSAQSCVYEKNLKPLECKELIGDRPFFVPPKVFFLF